MSWTQEQSDVYRQLAQIAVPHRVEQVTALLTLLPFAPTTPFRLVEMASGEGYLTQAILSAFTQASVLALDIEPTMRSETQRRSAAFADRLTTAPFTMERSDWYAHLDGADVVVSSLCVHHLDGEQKRALFRTIAKRTSGRGALLIADLVLPKRAQSRSLFAATWDQAASEAADARRSAAYALFEAEHWNYYRFPDDFDKPSPLPDQLVWLTEAGFHDVDCFWLSAGHAIYGGYGTNAGQEGIAYDDALRVVQKVFLHTDAPA